MLYAVFIDAFYNVALLNICVAIVSVRNSTFSTCLLRLAFRSFLPSLAGSVVILGVYEIFFFFLLVWFLAVGT
jgi:hypothetical protein